MGQSSQDEFESKCQSRITGANVTSGERVLNESDTVLPLASLDTLLCVYHADAL